MQTLCRVCFFFFYAGWGFGVIVVNEMIELSISHWFQAELAACLERDGFKSIVDAVGADCR